MAHYMRFSPLNGGYSVSSNGSNETGCPDGVQWVWKVIGDCVVTTNEQVSAYMGIASILLWMMVSIPQIIKNFRNLEGLAGVSFFLIFQWSGGDTTNLIGSVLTHQLKFQIYLAVYFVFTDVVLLVQYGFYYIRKRKRLRQYIEESQEGNYQPNSQLILCFMGLFAISHTIISFAWDSSDSSLSSTSVKKHFSRSLLSFDESTTQQPTTNTTTAPQTTTPIFWHDTVDILGYVIGVISSIFYLGSRTAQIIKNYQRKSTEGLAVLTFIIAVFGNLTYGGQILFRSLEEEFLLEKLPWLVGSLGVIGLDVTLLFQFHYYNVYSIDPEKQSLLSNDFTGTIIVRAEDTISRDGYTGIQDA